MPYAPLMLVFALSYAVTDWLIVSAERTTISGE